MLLARRRNKTTFDDHKSPYDTSKVSLSRYFPKGTTYFYGYPSGDDSGFLNKVPPSVEELVSARPLACAGEDLKIVVFADAVNSRTVGEISGKLGTRLADKKQIVAFPRSVDVTLVGNKRNSHVKHHLKQLVEPGSLVMAQPFLDADLEHLYQIPPMLSNWLNDKQNMINYLPESLQAQRYASYQNGAEFAADTTKPTLPCVVKVSSSSAGDGVYICYTAREFKTVKKELQATPGAVFVEQFINAVENFGIQFGIPHDISEEIEIIGTNRQLTTPEGEFIGGIVDRSRKHPELEGVKQKLIHEILPTVRQFGWYGIGCFDVLVDDQGRCYIIDCNFRMTGMTAYLMLAANEAIDQPLVSFNGSFEGSLKNLRKTLDYLAVSNKVDRLVHVLALTERDGVCNFNAALLFHDYQKVADHASQLLRAGISSKALEQLTSMKLI